MDKMQATEILAYKMLVEHCNTYNIREGILLFEFNLFWSQRKKDSTCQIPREDLIKLFYWFVYNIKSNLGCMNSRW